MFKLAIFDLDGTLLNSLEDIADASNYALRMMGYPQHELSKFNHFVGDGVMELCQRILPDDSKNRVQEALKYFADYYKEHSNDKTVVYDGIMDVLSELKQKGIKLAVASNKVHEFSVSMVKYYFGDVFDIVLGNAPERPKKPEPVIIYDIMKSMHVSADETVMIGDSDVDIITAENAGIKSIGCVWGYRGKEELERAGADFTADKPIDILKLL